MKKRYRWNTECVSLHRNHRLLHIVLMVFASTLIIISVVWVDSSSEFFPVILSFFVFLTTWVQGNDCVVGQCILKIQVNRSHKQKRINNFLSLWLRHIVSTLEKSFIKIFISFLRLYINIASNRIASHPAIHLLIIFLFD